MKSFNNHQADIEAHVDILEEEHPDLFDLDQQMRNLLSSLSPRWLDFIRSIMNQQSSSSSSPSCTSSSSFYLFDRYARRRSAKVVSKGEKHVTFEFARDGSIKVIFFGSLDGCRFQLLVASEGLYPDQETDDLFADDLVDRLNRPAIMTGSVTCDFSNRNLRKFLFSRSFGSVTCSLYIYKIERTPLKGELFRLPQHNMLDRSWHWRVRFDDLLKREFLDLARF